MMNLNRIEIKRFTKKYFKEYGNDIKRVSYIKYKNKIEYLVNEHYLFIKQLKNK